jgi:hypothetical protein
MSQALPDFGRIRGIRRVLQDNGAPCLDFDWRGTCAANASLLQLRPGKKAGPPFL